MKQNPWWEAINHSAAQKVPRVLWYTRVNHWPLSWAKWSQSISLKLISVSSSCLCMSSYTSLHFRFLTKILYAFLMISKYTRVVAIIKSLWLRQERRKRWNLSEEESYCIADDRFHDFISEEALCEISTFFSCQNGYVACCLICLLLNIGNFKCIFLCYVTFHLYPFQSCRVILALIRW